MRARTVAEFRARIGLMSTPEQTARGLAFRPRPDDVLISPFGKCGTTWLQQMVHTLRTRGDMDFDDISRVVPRIETAGALDIDLDAEQRACPRVFKSHLSWGRIPKGGRYLVSFRDPRDALVSMYRFMEGWFLEPGVVPIDEFAREAWMERGAGVDPERDSYWGHLASWWEQRERDDVLLLSYEGMRAAPEQTIRRVAAFCGIALDDELLALTLEHSSLAFMLQHKDRFDDRMTRELSERVAGLPPGSDSAKVRAGRVGAHREELSAELCAEIDAIWRETITPRFGFVDYAAMRKVLDAAAPDRPGSSVD